MARETVFTAIIPAILIFFLVFFKNVFINFGGSCGATKALISL